MPAHVPNAGLSRRDLLKRTGGLAALAAFTAACGGNTGRPSSGGGSGGSKPNLSQWYHQYGETGTQQAALKYAKAYPDANVAVQWTPGDYGAKLASGLLSSKGPDVFEGQLQHQHGEEQPGRGAGRHHGRRQGRLPAGRPGHEHPGRQDLRDPDDHRPAGHLLQEESAGQGRDQAAGDDRRPDLRGQGTHHEQGEGHLRRQRRRHRHGRTGAVLVRRGVPDQGQQAWLHR